MNELLNKYKKFDKLDTDRNFIKILVSYIKPSFLFKSKILTPIHLGRAVESETSKDGFQNNKDLEWLHTNCEYNDDFEGGISQYNRRVGFLTGTYWAWKNYDKLGNPEYFGSFGYRRLLNPDFLDNLKDFDIILPKQKDFKIETIKEQFYNYHGELLYQNMLEKFNKIYPEEIEQLEKYLCGTKGYFDELYVMKRDIFFKFCEWIFPLVFEYLKQPQIMLKNNDLRDIGFIMERITGYYCNKLVRLVNAYETEIIISEKMVINKQILNKNLFAKLRKNL